MEEAVRFLQLSTGYSRRWLTQALPESQLSGRAGLRMLCSNVNIRFTRGFATSHAIQPHHVRDFRRPECFPPSKAQLIHLHFTQAWFHAGESVK